MSKVLEQIETTMIEKKQVASFLELGEGLQMEDLRAEPTTLTAAVFGGRNALRCITPLVSLKNWTMHSVRLTSRLRELSAFIAC